MNFLHLGLTSAILMVATGAFHVANAQDALQMSIQASKVVANEDGTVSYVPASTAKPGTVIQYKATYSNTTDKPINDVMVTLPIPINMTFNGDVHPASAQGSIDGTNFADIPLMRRIDGKLVAIPYSEYKALRWSIKLLPAKKSANVALNAVID